MPTERNIKYIFISQAQPEDTFTLVEFKGTEGISKLYRFEIIIYSDDPDIDLKKMLKSPAKLTIDRDGETQRTVHGILARLEQLHEISGHVYYRAILVPRLWVADQHHENQLFLDKKVPDILEEILKQTSLTTNDYELKLTGNYRPWEYVCQYNETDFDFISRWMEREGIYYYFEHGDQAEKLIITDSSTAHQDIPSGKSVRYSPPDSLTPTTTEQIREFTCHQQMLPKKVILKDYNYRKPSLDLKGEADVDSEGRGNVYIYGEHFKTPEEGNALAKIRAEELICREAIFYGEGTVPPFLTGYFFEMYDHYRDSYNQRYLITELSHQGFQPTDLSRADGAHDEQKKPVYLNNFTAIKADIQFRPQQLAEKPKIDGTLNAKIDATGDGQYAEIDDEGRYKVILPFDQSGNKDGKASRWIRMSQPYSGADYGMHFPLHKGTEVLLTFVDGDPDRPIIAGTVPNPETGSPVKGGNQTQSMIRTGGGNQIRIEDSAGAEQIHLSTPHSGTVFSMGAPNGAPGFFLNTAAEMFTKIGQHLTQQVDANVNMTTSGNKRELIEGNTHTTHVGNKLDEMLGTAHEKFVGAKTSYKLANELELVAGTKESLFIGFAAEIKAGGALVRSPQTHEIELGKKEKNATKEAQVGQMKEQIASLKEQIGQFNEKIGTINQQITSANQKIATLKQDIGSINQSVKASIISCAGRYRVDGGFVTLYGKGGSALELNANALIKGSNVDLKETVKINGTTVKVSR
jgi:type VI secretion system secreted protein VgrG